MIHKKYPEEVKNAAKCLYLKRHAVPEIARTLNIPERTVYDWISKGAWDDLLSHEGPDEAISRRLALLVEREDKTPVDLKEIDLLISAQERRLRLRERERASAAAEINGGEHRESPFAGEVKAKKDKAHRGKIKNDVSHLTVEDFKKRLHINYFAYQHAMRAELERRNRMYLKARQIGATWYFAQEALENATLTGDNQIFLSATKAQSLIFRQYIIDICGQAFDITLSGNPLMLHTAHGPAALYFLATSSRSAQGYHGHVYGDEFFWIPKFQNFWKVASGMAAHRKWRRTMFSTPSIITHEAYPRWSGKEYLSRFKNPKPWPDTAALRAGLLCPDGTYRRIITLDEAERGGCNLFNRAELELEYSPEEFKQLFNCEFIDDTHAVFSLAALEPCMEDPEDWNIDFKLARPVGDAAVWGGYDPSRSRDDASFVVLLPPQKEGDKIRILERHTWKGKSYLWQVGRIRELCEKYRFIHLGIDVTGPGQAVLENVRLFCPVAMPLTYSLMSKAALVLKAQEVIDEHRLAWDAAQTDIAHAFMTIRQVATPTWQVTYAAHRTDTTGHADVAWATMHALVAEPLARKTRPGGARSSIAFSGAA
jgi:uncharacterized protein YjcR